MKAHVYITLKAGVLDAQGKATENALKNLGFESLSSVRLGKFIELELVATSESSARAEVEQMCEKLLANTVIESYRVELLKDAA
jgi:phosphoribosylformylglycinamidine synthase subunit PurS